MYSLRVETNFSAALYLLNTEGKYRNMHGHDFKVMLTLRSETLNKNGMVYDYSVLEKHLRDAAGELDHTLLNDLPEFADINPTAETISEYFYNKMKAQLSDLPLFQVEVCQTGRIVASYSPGLNV